MLKILFIDEDTRNQERFERYVYKSSLSEEIALINKLPLNSLDNMISEILNINPDVIVADYKLNDKKSSVTYNVPYNGVELIEAFLNIKQYFPCFVMTDYDREAVPESIDVNKIYVKDILDSENSAHFTFLERVKSQHENYIRRINEAEEQLKLLIEISGERDLTLNEEEKLIELDTFLERSIDARNPLPRNLKEVSNQTKLVDLLSKVDEFIEKVNTNG